nr:phosphoribosylformylglycinamidine synthase subunit PurL [Chlorobium phaeobacteroides]
SLGMAVNLEQEITTPSFIQELLFSEAQGRVLLSVRPENAARVIEKAEHQGVPAKVIGQVREQDVSIAVNGKEILSFDTAELKQTYYHALEEALHLDEIEIL